LYSKYFKKVFFILEELLLLKNDSESGVVVYPYNPSTLEAEAGLLSIQDHPGLQRDTLPQKNKG
jgi:hypothetical protein